jgi:hypothetical protein
MAAMTPVAFVMPARRFREPRGMPVLPAARVPVTSPRARLRQKEDHMVPLLLWILGVPGLIILLLLILGIVHI